MTPNTNFLAAITVGLGFAASQAARTSLAGAYTGLPLLLHLAGGLLTLGCQLVATIVWRVSEVAASIFLASCLHPLTPMGALSCVLDRALLALLPHMPVILGFSGLA